MKRNLLPVLLVFILTLMAACAAPPSQPPADPAQSDAPAQPAQPAAPEATATPVVTEYGGGDTQLIFWHGLTGADGVTMQAMVEQFAADNPVISVRIEAMPWNIYFDKLLTSMVSGSPPDVFIVREFENAGFARQGVLLDTSTLYESGGGPLPDDDFKPELLSALEYEGTRYGVPLDNLGWGVWINRDLFEAAGLDPDTPPTNEAELVEMARALTLDANGNHPGDEGFNPEQVAQWGIAINNPKNTYQSVLWQYGGDVFSEGTALLTEEPARAAMNFLYSLIYEENVAPPPAGFDVLQAFGAGQLAILPYGTWGLNFMRDSSVNWDVWPMIQIGPERATRMSSHVLHMPAGLDAERIDAATRLIVYLSENGLTWASSGQVPARFSVQEQLDPEADRAVMVFAESFREQGRLETPHPLKQEIAAAWEPEIDGAWNNVTSVDEALNTANERVQDVLDRQ
jgi:ABC-type glycerol-3-phosphate transport system substrate-binding protein